MRRLIHQLLHGAMAFLIAATAACRAPLPRVPFGRTEGNARLLAQQGAAALEQGDLHRAEKLLAEAIRMDSADSQSRCCYAEVLRRRGRLAEAAEQLRQAARLSPNDVDVCVGAAAVYVELRQYDAAQWNAERAITLAPQRADAWLALGRVMRAKGELQQALAALHRGLSLAPEDRNTRFELAEVYRQMHQPHRALAVLNALAATYPPGEEPQQLFHLKGLAYLALGRYSHAAEALAAACAREQPSAELLNLLAQAQQLADRTAENRYGDPQKLALNPRQAEYSAPPPAGAAPPLNSSGQY